MFRLLCVLVLSAAAGAAEPAADSQPTAGPSPAGAAVADPNSLGERARGLREAFQEQLSALNQALLATAEPGQRTALQRQIIELKAVHEIDMLQLQLEHAQELGKSETTQELQAALTHLREELRKDRAARAARGE